MSGLAELERVAANQMLDTGYWILDHDGASILLVPAVLVATATGDRIQTHDCASIFLVSLVPMEDY
ncbi:MAG: hypothetical protein EA359_15625 [Balneolaceae bacterium]|nr:MAG: hypothetical protein EA359_15625 [Balneolaceae bacterium]